MQGRWTLLHVIGLVVWQKHVKSLSLSLCLTSLLICSLRLNRGKTTALAHCKSHSCILALTIAVDVAFGINYGGMTSPDSSQIRIWGHEFQTGQFGGRHSRNLHRYVSNASHNLRKSMFYPIVLKSLKKKAFWM